MPLANYTTSVEAAKTVGEIQHILVAHGAREILLNYGDDGVIESLSFIVNTAYGNMPIKLPVSIEPVLKVMQRDSKIPNHLCNKEQAVRVAWRILKDWVRAQMAILETDMVRLEQIYPALYDNPRWQDTLREYGG
jgi:predicted SpoU family rRNA methylase